MRGRTSPHHRYSMKKTPPTRATALSRAIVLVPIFASALILVYLVTGDANPPEKDTDAIAANAQTVSPSRPEHATREPGLEPAAKLSSPFTASSRSPTSATKPITDSASKGSDAKPSAEELPLIVESSEEHIADLEVMALEGEASRQDRAEALVELTRLDLARGVETLGQLLSVDSSDERQLAVSLLRETRLRYGDDGRIQHLLYQASTDPDEGVAYQARSALQVESSTGESSPY